MLSLDLFLADTETLARSGLRFVHFLGLALGLGTATVLDLIALRFFLMKEISRTSLDLFEFGSKIVSFGLRLLWASGVGFLVFYLTYSPDVLTNPKIHAKLAIVVILTLNSMIIHGVVLPFLRNQVGKQMFEDTSRGRQRIFIATATISAVSWYTPLLIANLPQLNFQVPMVEILMVYGGLLLAVYLLALLAMPRGAKRAPVPDNVVKLMDPILPEEKEHASA